MLLNIYLGTAALNLITVILTSIAVKKRLKREGYVFVKNNKSLAEKIFSYVSIIFKASIPVFNIINTIYILYLGEKVYEIMEEKLLEEDEIIYKPNDIIKSNVLTIKDTKNYSEKNKMIEKTYDEMTIEEKLAFLEQEKQKLLNNSIQNNKVYKRKR